MPTFVSQAPKQLSDGSSRGVTMGLSANDRISFYNATPVTQPTGATSNVPVTASSQTLSGQLGSTAGVGFSTVAMFGAFVSTIAFMQTDLLAVQANLNALHQAMSSTGFTKGS